MCTQSWWWCVKDTAPVHLINLTDFSLDRGETERITLACEIKSPPEQVVKILNRYSLLASNIRTWLEFGRSHLVVVHDNIVKILCEECLFLVENVNGQVRSDLGRN
jgi:hypothetical protein